MNKKYSKFAEVVFSAGDKKIVAYAINKRNGKKDVRLHVQDENGNLSEPIEFSRTKIDNVTEIMNYVQLGEVRDIKVLKQTLKTEWFSLPCIEECEGLGFQRNKENEIEYYMGAECYDCNGNTLIKDEFSTLPQCKGSMSDVVTRLNEYMHKNIKRQIALVHAFSGAVCGLIERNIILSVVGESSTGKTTLQKLGVSFFTQTDYSGTVLKWSATQNALIKRMDGLSGVNVLIDDTQLSRIKKFAQIIYSLENGQSIDRLAKGNELCKSYHWSVSVGITAEKSLLDTINDLGAVARLIEMTVHKRELFDDEREARNIQNLYQNHYGKIGTALVKNLLVYGNVKVQERIQKEGQTLCKIYEKRINDNNILKRHLVGDVAIMVVTASLVNEWFGFEFQVPFLRSALLSLCEENYNTFEQNKFENVVINIVYADIVATIREAFPQNERNGKIVVPSTVMKGLLSKYAMELKVKASAIKEELARLKLLSKRGCKYCWNHTINGKDVTGYEIIVEEKM